MSRNFQPAFRLVLQLALALVFGLGTMSGRLSAQDAVPSTAAPLAVPVARTDSPVPAVAPDNAAPAAAPSTADQPAVDTAAAPATDPTADPAAGMAMDLAAAIQARDEAAAKVTELDGKIAELSGKLDEAEGRIAEMQGRLDEAGGLSAGLQGTLDATEGRRAELQGKLDETEGRIAEIQGLLDYERTGRRDDEEAAATLRADLLASIDGTNSELDDLRSQVEELQAKLAERDGLADQLAVLEAERDRYASQLAAEVEGRIDLEAWPTLLVSGFADATARIGKWKLGKDTAEQTDPKQFFSRLEFPLEQRGQSYLYRFAARATGSGWVGFGIHFFASDVRSRKGYGEGRSLLVWFTRDPAVRKTDATWLQLYRSDNDVVMERVVDAKLEDSVEMGIAVEVSYDPDSGYITVTADGRLAIRYRAWFGIEEGVGISLRTLGAGVQFADFEVRTK